LRLGRMRTGTPWGFRFLDFSIMVAGLRAVELSKKGIIWVKTECISLRRTFYRRIDINFGAK